jgi:ArsR family transcriptional regulator, lead/cadmium/zinc/bismuth-responsive transcriptional repressor
MTLKSNLRLLKSLAEETRYRIVKLLLKGEKCACEIPKLIGRTQSNTSMHLAMLSRSGIIRSKRNGKKIVYSINDLRVYKMFKDLDHHEGKLFKSCCSIDKNKKKR